MCRAGPSFSPRCLLQCWPWLIPCLSASPFPSPTLQPLGRARTQKQQVQSHQIAHYQRDLPSSLTPMCQDNKGLFSFLGFQLPSPLPLLSVFPACHLPRRVDGCLSGPRGEKKGPQKDTLLLHPPESCLLSACSLLSPGLRLWNLISASWEHHEVGTRMVPTFQVEKLRHREIQ